MAQAIVGAGFDPHSHDGKATLNILETFPRDELFQYDDATLLQTVLGILHLQERPRTALFVRPDRLGRSVTCLVFTPRERYDSALRQRFAAVLQQAFGGKVVSYSATLADDSPLARVLFTVRLGAPTQSWNQSEIEAGLAQTARTWRDRLRDALVAALDEQRGLSLARRYAHAFPVGYQEIAEIKKKLTAVEKETAQNQTQPKTIEEAFDRDPDREPSRISSSTPG